MATMVNLVRQLLRSFCRAVMSVLKGKNSDPVRVPRFQRFDEALGFACPPYRPSSIVLASLSKGVILTCKM